MTPSQSQLRGPSVERISIRFKGINSVLRIGAKAVLCGLLLTAAGCAVDDHRPAKTPVAIGRPPEPAAPVASLTPGPSPTTIFDGARRGEITVAYVSNEGVAVPEPVVTPAPLPPTARGATGNPIENSNRNPDDTNRAGMLPVPAEAPVAE